MATNQPQNLSEWQLHGVLQKVNLLQYYDNFIREGECDVLTLSNAEDKTFKNVMEKVGMAKKPLHVRRFRNTLIQWVDDPGKNDHVPSYIKKGCDDILSHSEKKPQESQNIPTRTSTVSTSRLGRIANTIGFLESQNIPAGTRTVLTSSGERSASTVGNLERHFRVIQWEQENNESTQSRNSGRTTETPQEIFETFRRFQPNSGRITDQVAVGYRTGDSQIMPSRKSASLRTEQLETLSSVLSSHSTASSHKDIMDITRELHGNDTNTNTLNDFLPEIEPFGDVGQNYYVDALKDVLKHYRKLTIKPISEEDALLMEVRRGNVLLDAIAMIRISEDDLHNPLSIKFSDEEGEDCGGLRREFWSLLLYNITHSCYVTGKPGRQTFQKNFIERKKNTFLHLGQLIALSILQDGPGLPIFSDIVTDYIMTGKTSVLNIDDLPDGLKDTLEKMQNCESDKEAREIYSSVIDIAVDACFIVPLTSFTKCHVKQLKAAFIENQISSCRDELDQFIKGLDTHRVLSLLCQTENIASARCLFSGRVKPLTVSQLRELIRFKYKEGNAKFAQMATAQGFLTFLQATKGTATIINGINLQPKDVLMWLTGSTIVPAIGFHKPIDVYFSRTKTFVNTCALVLTLKTQPDLSSGDAVSYYTELIINSQTFTKQ